MTLLLNIIGSDVTIGTIKAIFNANNAQVGQCAIFTVESVNAYSQADPRSNIVNGTVIYQPPLSIFDGEMDAVCPWIGDQQLILTPNSNYKQAIIESCVPDTVHMMWMLHGTHILHSV